MSKIDIKARAQKIREKKIKELKNVIKSEEKGYKENQGTMFEVDRCHTRIRINELKAKLIILETK